MNLYKFNLKSYSIYEEKYNMYYGNDPDPFEEEINLINYSNRDYKLTNYSFELQKMRNGYRKVNRSNRETISPLEWQSSDARIMNCKDNYGFALYKIDNFRWKNVGCKRRFVVGLHWLHSRYSGSLKILKMHEIEYIDKVEYINITYNRNKSKK